MSEQIITKRCSRCKQTKPISEFNKNQYYCKICMGIYRQTEKGEESSKRSVRKYKKTDKGKFANKQHAQSEKGKATQKRADYKYHQTEKGKAVRKRADYKYAESEKGKVTKNRYRMLHPERLAACKVINQAIKSGKLPRPDSLQCACGESAKQYHHHKGYAPEHWLDVIPLCVKCHKIAHKTCLI